MIWISASLAVAVVWAAGALTTRAARLGPPAGSRGVFDLAAGCAVLGVLAMMVIAAGGRLVPWLLGAPVVIGVACLILHQMKVPHPAREPWRIRLPRVEPVAGALILLTCLVLGGIVLSSARDVLWWDGWAIWAMKSVMLLADGTLPPASLDPAGPLAFTHPDYPLALPVLQWVAYVFAGSAEPAANSFLGAGAFATLPLLLFSGVRGGELGRVIPAAAALGVALFWPLAFFARGGAADILIAVAALGATVELANLEVPAAERSSGAVAVYLALAVAAKNEGLVLALSFALGTIVVVLVRSSAVKKDIRRLWPLAVPFVAIAPWLAFTRAHGLSSSHLGGGLNLSEAADRVPLLLREIVSLFSDGPWTVLPLLWALGLGAAVIVRDARSLTLFGVLGAYLGCVAVVYLQAPPDLFWLLRTSLVRVIGALVPALVFAALFAVSRVPAVAARQ